MFPTTVVLFIFLALVLASLGAFKLSNHPKARETAEHIGITVNQSRVIGVLELSGSIGLLIGLAWAPLGIAAAVGFIILLLGATTTHLRIHDPVRIASFPFFLALVTTVTLILRIATA